MKKKNALLLRTIILTEHAARVNPFLFLKTFFFFFFYRTATTDAQDYHTSFYSNTQLFRSIFKIK